MNGLAPKRLSGALLLAGLGFAFLIDMAPASLAASIVAETSHGRVRLAETKGTLWHGSAQLMALGSEQQARGVTRLRWDFQPGALRHLAMAWQFSFDGQPGASLTLNRNGLQIDALKLTLPVTTLEHWIAGPLPVRGLSGSLQLNAPTWQCDWRFHACAGRSELQWHGARIASISETSLGSFIMTLDRDAHDAPWRYHLLTQSGVVKLALSGDADTQRATLNGTARADTDAPAKLQQWLLALGPRQGDTVQIKLSFPIGPKVGAPQGYLLRGAGGTAPKPGDAR